MYVQFSGGGSTVHRAGVAATACRCTDISMSTTWGVQWSRVQRCFFFKILLLNSRPQYTASAVVQCTGLVWWQRLADADISMPTNWEFHGAELRGLFENLAFTLEATVYFLQEVCEHSPNVSFWCKPAI